MCQSPVISAISNSPPQRTTVSTRAVHGQLLFVGHSVAANPASGFKPTFWAGLWQVQLICLAPCLDKDEVQQTLKAIDSQRWNREESEIFEAATIALRDRLSQLK